MGQKKKDNWGIWKETGWIPVERQKRAERNKEIGAKKRNSLHPRRCDPLGKPREYAQAFTPWFVSGSAFLQRLFCLYFIHHRREKFEIFSAYFFWGRNGTETLLLGRSLWLPESSDSEVPPPFKKSKPHSPGSALWQDAWSWVNPGFLRSAWFAFSVIMPLCLAQSSWQEQAW